MHYVLLDLDALVFRHKHENLSVVSNLAHIECAHNSNSIFPIDSMAGVLHGRLTETQLRVLYENTTGVKAPNFLGSTRAEDRLFALLREAAERLPLSDVISAEVHRQAAFISQEDAEFYRYVKGSNRAQALADLYVPPPLTCNPGSAARAAATAAPPPLASTSTTAAQAAAHSGNPPLGTTKALVWHVADQMWKAAGAPTDIARVLELRKQMMNTLEAEHNIKRTSSSTALGEWQKARLK